MNQMERHLLADTKILAEKFVSVRLFPTQMKVAMDCFNGIA